MGAHYLTRFLLVIPFAVAASDMFLLHTPTSVLLWRSGHDHAACWLQTNIRSAKPVDCCHQLRHARPPTAAPSIILKIERGSAQACTVQHFLEHTQPGSIVLHKNRTSSTYNQLLAQLTGSPVIKSSTPTWTITLKFKNGPRESAEWAHVLMPP